MNTPTRVTVAGLLTVPLLVACSSSGKSANSSSSASTTATSNSSSTAPATSSSSATASSSTPATSKSTASKPAASTTTPMSGAATAKGTGAKQTITVDLTDMLRFAPATINAKVGTVTVKLMDTGSYPHNMDVPSLKKKSADVSGNAGSQTTTLVLKFAKPGTYPFICTYHDQAGMKGKFVVTA